jgi:hypothetical protein
MESGVSEGPCPCESRVIACGLSISVIADLFAACHNCKIAKVRLKFLEKFMTSYVDTRREEAFQIMRLLIPEVSLPSLPNHNAIILGVM